MTPATRALATLAAGVAAVTLAGCDRSADLQPVADEQAAALVRRVGAELTERLAGGGAGRDPSQTEVEDWLRDPQSELAQALPTTDSVRLLRADDRGQDRARYVVAAYSVVRDTTFSEGEAWGLACAAYDVDTRAGTARTEPVPCPDGTDDRPF